nr:MAG TPA_asm: hypothetical protein [Caudoviricetes sp.]
MYHNNKSIKINIMKRILFLVGIITLVAALCSMIFSIDFGIVEQKSFIGLLAVSAISLAIANIINKK